MIDKVAEAIWRADRPDESAYTWDQCIYPKHYRHMAQAAINALGLTREWTWLVDGSYGYSQGSIFPTYEQAVARKSNAVILTSQRTPWAAVEELP